MSEMEPSQFLNWLADRLVTRYGEDPNTDFVLRLRQMASELEMMEGLLDD